MVKTLFYFLKLIWLFLLFLSSCYDLLIISQKLNKMKMKQYYSGKRLLVTGTTGFLGKVLLEKILYSLP